MNFDLMHAALSLLLVAALALLPSRSSRAEDSSPQAAYLNVVNLVTLKQPTRFTLGGFELNGGAPLSAGFDSGTLAIVPGDHNFTIENPGAIPPALSETLTLEHGKSYAVICYDERRPLPDGSTTYILRYNVLTEGAQTEGPRLSLISLLPDPFVSLDVSGESITLEARLVHTSPRQLKDEIQIRFKGTNLVSFEITKAIHYLAFLFENPESGKVEISLLRHETLEYQPPRSESKP